MSARGEALIRQFPERKLWCRCGDPAIDHEYVFDAGGHLIGPCRLCPPDEVCERFEAAA